MNMRNPFHRTNQAPTTPNLGHDEGNPPSPAPPVAEQGADQKPGTSRGGMSDAYLRQVGESAIGGRSLVGRDVLAGQPDPFGASVREASKTMLSPGGWREGNSSIAIIAQGPAADTVARSIGGGGAAPQRSCSNTSSFSPEGGDSPYDDGAIGRLLAEADAYASTPSSVPGTRLPKRTVAILAIGGMMTLGIGAKVTGNDAWIDSAIGKIRGTGESDSSQEAAVVPGANNGADITSLKDVELVGLSAMNRTAFAVDFTPADDFEGVTDTDKKALTTELPDLEIAILATADTSGKNSAIEIKDGSVKIDLEKVQLQLVPQEDTCADGTFSRPTFFGDGKTDPKYKNSSLTVLQEKGILPLLIDNNKATTAQLSKYMVKTYEENQLDMCYTAVGYSLNSIAADAEFTDIVKAGIAKKWSLSNPVYENEEAIKNAARSFEEAFLKANLSKTPTSGKIFQVDQGAEDINRTEFAVSSTQIENTEPAASAEESKS